jgi:flagellar hook assembly protein FlgD
MGIYSADGRRVRSLNSGTLSAGQHTFHWDRRDASGRPVAAGVYFVRLEAGGEVRSRRLTILH